MNMIELNHEAIITLCKKYTDSSLLVVDSILHSSK